MNREFMDAWRIVKHKGPVRLPSVEEKVYRAMKVVEPYIDWGHWFELKQEIFELGSKKSRGAWDGICKDIEIKLGIYEPKRRKKTWYGCVLKI